MVPLIVLFSVWSLIFSHQHLREPRVGGRIKGENVSWTDKWRGEGGVYRGKGRETWHNLSAEMSHQCCYRSHLCIRVHYQGQRKRLGQSGLGRTTFSLKKKEVPYRLPSMVVGIEGGVAIYEWWWIGLVYVIRYSWCLLHLLVLWDVCSNGSQDSCQATEGCGAVCPRTGR